MLTVVASHIIEKYRRTLSEAYGVEFVLRDDLPGKRSMLPVGSAAIEHGSDLNPQCVYIGKAYVDDKALTIDSVHVCNILVAMGHEAQHLNQMELLRNGEASDRLAYSWVADNASNRYYDLNYNLSYREIEAEQAGVDFALGVMTKAFGKPYANHVMKKRMKESTRMVEGLFGEHHPNKYMLAHVDENFAQRTDWHDMFDELKELSLTAKRSYCPQLNENHYVDDLERFYKRSEENEYFVLKSLNSDKTDKLICAAAIAENSGHYTKNAAWLPEGRSMLVNMKTDMLGYLWSVDPTLKPPPETEQSREAVDMSTVDVDDSLDLIETNESTL